MLVWTSCWTNSHYDFVQQLVQANNKNIKWLIVNDLKCLNAQVNGIVQERRNSIANTSWSYIFLALTHWSDILVMQQLRETYTIWNHGNLVILQLWFVSLNTSHQYFSLTVVTAPSIMIKSQHVKKVTFFTFNAYSCFFQEQVLLKYSLSAINILTLSSL